MEYRMKMHQRLDEIEGRLRAIGVMLDHYEEIGPFDMVGTRSRLNTIAEDATKMANQLTEIIAK